MGRDDTGRAAECAASARRIVAERGDLPHPGAEAGATARRWQAFADVARVDLSAARLVEGHHDATSILHELGHEPVGGLLGVWAARPQELVATRARPGGGWRLDGLKPFSSGATFLDAALVTATADDGPRLFVVAVRSLPAVDGTWTPLGMAATASATVRFDGVAVAEAAAIGGPDAYVDRPGFGHGGCGVAACWWGGTTAVLADVATVLDKRPDDVALAAFGLAALAVESTGAVLREAAQRIDADPSSIEQAEALAWTTRCSAAESGHRVLDVAARHLGTSTLGTDRAVAGRVTDVTTYLTQYAARTAVDLGRRYVVAPPATLC